MTSACFSEVENTIERFSPRSKGGVVPCCEDQCLRLSCARRLWSSQWHTRLKVLVEWHARQLPSINHPDNSEVFEDAHRFQACVAGDEFSVDASAE